MNKQRSLDLADKKSAGLEALINFSPVHVNKSTFKAGLAAKCHRWFRLTPSFGPDLVQIMLDRLNSTTDDVVLDPFAGASTTLIECKLNSIPSFGFEVNPLLQFVGRVSLEWRLSAEELRTELDCLLRRYDSSPTVDHVNELESIGLIIPPIHNPLRWWRPDILIDLLRLKREINFIGNERIRDFFRLGFAGVLVPDLTNITLGRLQLHFIDKSEYDMNVRRSFANHIRQMIDDVASFRDYASAADATVYLQNTLDLREREIEKKASVVITSPPYPNRYSYIWNTRPHLYMLDLMTVAKEASDIDKKTIGGTWGTATSELAKEEIAPRSKGVASALAHILPQLRLADLLMSNYVVHYFNRLEVQIEAMEKVTTRKKRVAYVVGNSEIKGVYIDTDVILAKIFEACGLQYRVDEICRFRKRNSGQDLYESIVYART